MARGMHRHRHIRLTTTREINNQKRVDGIPRKLSERKRRDARMVATIKAAKGADYSPAVKSWITAKLGLQWRQVKPADIKAAIAAK
jgi:hypothetical protein